MKILFDFQSLYPKYGGIPRYHFELSSELSKWNVETEISTLFSQSAYLKSDSRYKIIDPIGNFNFKGKNMIIQNLQNMNKLYSISKLKSNQFDIFHPTYYDNYFLKYLKKPFVFTLHDFILEKYQPLDYKKVIDQKKNLALNANHIIAISENTKNDIIKYYGIEEKKITVIHHGYRNIKLMENSNKFGDYILFVGQRGGYKNFKNFIEAMIPILQVNTTLKIICTGYAFSKIENLFLKDKRLIDQVLAVKVNDLELNNLYFNAKLFVFPSLYEGFGMPILEAFAAECPICISNTSCFPEIAKDAAIYFDPLSIDSIRLAVLYCLSNPDALLDLVQKGKQRLESFSWEKTALETIDVYKSV